MVSLKKIPPNAWIIICLCVSVLSLSSLRAFRNYELLFYDLRFRLRPPLATSKDIVLIEISDDTLKSLKTWPLPRDFHADFVDVLKECGVKSIVFDIVFSEPTLYDVRFSEAIRDSKCVYLPVVFGLSATQPTTYQVPQARGILGDIVSSFKKYAAGVGHINTFVDPDGKVRKAPLFIRHNNTFIPHLALKVACDFLGVNAHNVEFKGNSVIVDKKLKMPVSFNNSFMANYPDKWAKSFKHLSYIQILKAYSDVSRGIVPKIDLSQLKGKVCFVGLTATATHDLKPTPLERSYPMVGLHASIFSSVVGRQFINDVGPLINTIINLLIFALAFFVCVRLSPLKSLLATTLSGLGYFGISVVSFIFWGIVIDVFLPLCIIGATYAGVTLYKFLDEIRRRQLLEKELDIARQIQKSFLPQDIQEFLDIEIFSFMQPAKFVAGDLYDIIVLDKNRLGVFIGDVSGKGVPASLIMAQTVSLLRVFAKTCDDPAHTLTQLNKELSGVLQGRFVTALYLIIDTQTRIVHASCAGHSPLLVYAAAHNRVDEFLPTSGPPLGVIDSLTYERFQCKLAKGDRFLLYTDGVTEARSRSGEEFGVNKLKSILFMTRQLPTGSIMDNFKGEIFRFFKGVRQHDDITLVLLNVKGMKK
ncbi:MAG: CHASE2 domain-containing protein [Candidatus Omnitrophota bacterium]|nr:MAG: CHASE2 domain-containing protein [Candidatus Omnitrophota bacterium]